MRFTIHTICLLLLPLCFFACKSKSGPAAAEAPKETVTPVTVAGITREPITEYIELNATSVFLQKNFVKANTGGYVQAVNAQIGKFVSKGQLLFTIKTKEAQSIGNAITELDPAFKFTGVNKIVASSGGYITQLNHQAGDYVQDGEQLAVISDRNSFVFLLNLPYELHRYIAGQKNVDLVLPDSTVLKGIIISSMPSMDSASQTESYVIKTNGSALIPENLVARARIVKLHKDNTQSLPKAAVLTNDIQSEYWVMKMIDSGTAVKVEIQKGIATNGRIEILSPQFTPGDKILVTGNYGLGDTAKVKIIQQ